MKGRRILKLFPSPYYALLLGYIFGCFYFALRFLHFFHCSQTCLYPLRVRSTYTLHCGWAISSPKTLDHYYYGNIPTSFHLRSTSPSHLPTSLLKPSETFSTHLSNKYLLRSYYVGSMISYGALEVNTLCLSKETLHPFGKGRKIFGKLLFYANRAKQWEAEYV